MTCRSSGWLVLLGSVACQGGPVPPPARDAVVKARPGMTVQPLVTFGGSQCAITEPAMHRVRTQAELRALWDRHRGTEDPVAAVRWAEDGLECPCIDFERCEVIVVFRKQDAGGGVHAAEVLDDAAVRRLRLAKDGAQTASLDGRRRVRRYTEFGYLVLPRRDVPVVIEVDGCNLIGGAPAWEEVARL